MQLQANKLKKKREGAESYVGQQLCETSRDGDTTKVNRMPSTQCAQSFINYQDTDGVTLLHHTSVTGHSGHGEDP